MAPKKKSVADMKMERLRSRQQYLASASEMKTKVKENVLQEDIRAIELKGGFTNQSNANKGGEEEDEVDMKLLEKRVTAQEIMRQLNSIAKKSTNNDSNEDEQHSLPYGGGGDAGQDAQLADEKNDVKKDGYHNKKRDREGEEEDLRFMGEQQGQQQHQQASMTSSGMIQLDDDEVQSRIAQHQYTMKKSEAELQQERMEAMESKFEKIQTQRRSLPIYKVKEELLKIIHDNQCVVIQGETGCGKTTQLLQYVYEERHRLFPSNQDQQKQQPSCSRGGGVQGGGSAEPGREENNIQQRKKKKRFICTQPRRIAATSVAERVATEMGVTCGSVVGYKVRFDDKSTPGTTEILYVTDGMMLKELESDIDLSTVNMIMIDEAHERSLSSDILLGLLKGILKGKTKDELKVVVASATLATEQFCRFFNNAPKFSISGRTFPVTLSYSLEPVPDHVAAAATTAMEIHTEKPLPGDILIFLPGQEDIERCARLIEDFAKEMGSEIRELLVTPIYSSLPPQVQKRIYAKTPSNARKVVIATNIAETSITVDGIVYVIDSGLCKQNFFNPRTMMEELAVVPTSQASAEQRKGRAGRTQPGECIRLYTKHMYHNELEKETVPEIRRCNLNSVVLHLVDLIGMQNLLTFNFLDAPSMDSLKRAVNHLFALGAVDQKGHLLHLGKQISAFPVDPALGKCLVQAELYGCTKEMAAATAMLTLQNSVFNVTANNNEEEERAIKGSRARLYAGGSGDVFGLVRVFQQWCEHDFSERWCKANRVNYKTLLRARDVYQQVLSTFERLGIDIVSAMDDAPSGEGGNANPLKYMDEQLTRTLASGFFQNCARIELDKVSYTVIRSQAAQAKEERAVHEQTVVKIHPSSYLHKAGDQQQKRPHGELMTKREVNDEDDKDNVLNTKPSLVLFTELRHTKEAFMIHVTSIRDPDWVLEAAPKGFFSKDSLSTEALRHPTK